MRINKLNRLFENDSWLLLSTSEDMRYFASFTGEGFVLLSKKERRIYTDGRYTEQALRETNGFDVLDIRKLKKDLSEIKKIIYFQEKNLTFSDYSGLSQVADLKPSNTDFSELRSVKDESEIDNLIKAAKIGEEAYLNTLSFITPGKSEKEIAAYLNYQMALLGAEKQSFDTICISGKNTSLPHGVPSDKLVCEGEFLTMDFGCVYNGYCSDMTRTVAIGYISDEMEFVYSTVLSAQDKCEKYIKPDITCAECDEVARKIIVDAGYGDYFIHSTGHGVGLLIHEYPNLAPKKENILKKGQVVTVEPGIYLPQKFGVRIENTVILTENGCQPLQKCEKDLIIL